MPTLPRWGCTPPTWVAKDLPMIRQRKEQYELRTLLLALGCRINKNLLFLLFLLHLDLFLPAVDIVGLQRLGRELGLFFEPLSFFFGCKGLSMYARNEYKARTCALRIGLRLRRHCRKERTRWLKTKCESMKATQHTDAIVTRNFDYFLFRTNDSCPRQNFTLLQLSDHDT